MFCSQKCLSPLTTLTVTTLIFNRGFDDMSQYLDQTARNNDPYRIRISNHQWYSIGIPYYCRARYVKSEFSISSHFKFAYSAV
ncbi:hypothetical protein CEXT_152331 [Caerostris extrusa]|uniref:Uncharacterized protein n=1 Tax=Caerostris extrusa TaxID=172846 RepID=A0AAV4TJV4_CAEEX|nr:hypothetical protein CEXT_152331 [Caerostris extrusa]